MKKVLFLATNDFNRFGGGGQAIRAYLDSTLEIFGKDKVDVMVGTEYVMLDEYEDLNFIHVCKRNALISRLEVLCGYLDRWVTPLIKYLKKHRNEYDLVIINSGRMGVAVPSIKNLGLKVVTIHHNEEVEYCMDNKHLTTFGGRWDYLVRHAQCLAYKYSDINFFLTQRDCELLHFMYGENRKVNEIIGVYDYRTAAVIAPLQKGKEFHIGITGSLGNYQTTHGIMDIKNNYWDILMNLIPNLKLIMTGRDPSSEIMRFGNEHRDIITVVSSPQNIISVIQKASIYLSPTDIGGGLKLRAMDGLKSGMPVLAHKVSARGYDMFLGKPYFRVYHDRYSFKQGLSDILKFVSGASVQDRVTICQDFYKFFSYQAGTERVKKVLKE